MQFVRVPTRLQAEMPNPIQVFLIDQVKRKGAAGFYQSPRMMLAGHSDQHTWTFRLDAGLTDKSGNQSARGIAGARSHQPNHRVYFRPNLRNLG